MEFSESFIFIHRYNGYIHLTSTQIQLSLSRRPIGRKYHYLSIIGIVQNRNIECPINDGAVANNIVKYAYPRCTMFYLQIYTQLGCNQPPRRIKDIHFKQGSI